MSSLTVPLVAIQQYITKVILHLCDILLKKANFTICKGTGMFNIERGIISASRPSRTTIGPPGTTIGPPVKRMVSFVLHLYMHI